MCVCVCGVFAKVSSVGVLLEGIRVYIYVSTFDLCFAVCVADCVVVRTVSCSVRDSACKYI